jgi:divinyl chlorophyllide a 8-vinyl-reductase
LSCCRQPPRIKQVPVALMDGIIGVLGTAGRVVPALAAKAELARIGRYYATESMLVWDAAAGRYRRRRHAIDGTQTLRGPLRRAAAAAAPPTSGATTRCSSAYSAKSYSIVIGAWSENFSAL